VTFQKLEIENFRNISGLSWELGEGLNVLEGANGQGKTNLLEALYFLAHGRSFRTRVRISLIKKDQAMARLGAQIRQGELTHNLKCSLSEERRELLWNGKAQSHWTKVYGILQVLLFTPESTGLFRTAPAGRRRYFDQAIGAIVPEYSQGMLRYQRVLQQRNQMLKDRVPSQWREPYDLQWAQWTRKIMDSRQEYLMKLMPFWESRLGALTSGIGGIQAQWEGTLAQEFPPEEEELLTRLRAVEAEELRTGHSRLGPHRDDLVVYWQGRPVKEIASQGQQRLMAIALKLAEADLYRESRGHAPVFLLDDVGSELDPKHLAQLLQCLRNMASQTVLTTAHPGEYAALEAKTFTIRGGNCFEERAPKGP
jgi:DNA replication and repair protein RecF